MRLRPYAPADWDAVCQIHDAARVQELAAGGVDPRAFKPMTEVAAGDEFFVSEVVVACAEEQALGFVAWHGAYITWLYVDPAQQRQGIGRLLLQHALRIIGPEAWTSMLGGNEAALKLYQSLGLEVVWQRPTLCDGFPCEGVRLALPTSRMRNPDARREKSAATR